MPKKHKVCIIGAEGWGSAISTAVCENVISNNFDPRVHIYVYDELVRSSYLSEVMNERHENIKYLPGIELSKNLIAVNDLVEAAGNADILIFATPQDFVKPYCNILAGKIKSTAYAVSLIKGLDHIKDGEIDLYSHSIAKQLQIPCYSVMNANCAMEMAQGKLCEITIGCNNMEHVEQLSKLFQTENFKVFCIEDVHGVELCNTLKDLVAISAGFVDGLRLGENARVACLHLGLKEMMRFIKNFNPSTKLSTFFESCGIANSVVSSYADKNVTFAKTLATSRKTVQEIEANLLNGRKLLGPMIAEEIYGYLEKNNLKEKYPIFSVIHRICQNEVPPEAILNTLRNHPDLKSYSITELEKDEVILRSLDDEVIENVVDTVPDSRSNSMQKAIFQSLDAKTLKSFDDQDEGFWKPYDQYFTVPENAVELRQFLNSCQKSTLNAKGAMNESTNNNEEFSLQLNVPNDKLDQLGNMPKFSNIESQNIGEIRGNIENMDTTCRIPKEFESQYLTRNVELMSQNDGPMVIKPTSKGNEQKQTHQGLKSLIDHYVKPFNEKYEALKVRVKPKNSSQTEEKENLRSKLEDLTKFGANKNLDRKATQKPQSIRIRRRITKKISSSAEIDNKNAKAVQAEAKKKSKPDRFDNDMTVFGVRQSDPDRGVSLPLEIMQKNELDAIDEKVIGNSNYEKKNEHEKEHNNEKIGYNFNFDKDYEFRGVSIEDLQLKSVKIVSEDSPKQYSTNEERTEHEQSEWDKRKNQMIQPTELSKNLDGVENQEDKHQTLFRGEYKENKEEVPEINQNRLYAKQRPASRDLIEYVHRLRAGAFEDEPRFLSMNSRQISDGENEKSAKKIYNDNQHFDVGRETSKLKQESSEEGHPLFSAYKENQEPSEKYRNYSLDDVEGKDLAMRRTEEYAQELPLREKKEKTKYIERRKETRPNKFDKNENYNSVTDEPSQFTVRTTRLDPAKYDKLSTLLEKKVAQYDDNVHERKRMARMKKITEDNMKEMTETEENDMKNQHPEWNWLLDEIKDEDELYKRFENNEEHTRELKETTDDSLEKGQTKFNKKESFTAATEQEFDDESTKPTSSKLMPREVSYEGEFPDETLKPGRKQHTSEVKDQESNKSTKLQRQNKISDDQQKKDHKTYEPEAIDEKTNKSAKFSPKNEVHGEEPFKDEYMRTAQLAFALDAEEQETYNASKQLPQDEISNEDQASKRESTEFSPQTEPSYKDSSKYLTPLAKGRSKEKHSKALQQDEERLGPVKKMDKLENESNQILESRLRSKRKNYRKESSQEKTIKPKVDNTNLTEKLVHIMGKNKRPKEVNPKEQKVEYRGKDPYYAKGDILPRLKTKSKDKSNQTLIRKSMMKQSYYPPINPRVRIPRPPFDVRDHEYHTVNYHPTPNLLFRQSVLPYCHTSATYQVKSAAAKNVSKLPRPALKLPMFLMRSSILAIELGLFAAFFTRFKGSCR